MGMTKSQKKAHGPGIKGSSTGVCALNGLNIIFAVVASAVVATSLDYQSTAPYCYLNVSGQVCVFTYVTTGAAIFLSLCVVVPILILMPQKGHLIGIYLSITLFSFFWQLVYALTVTIRGRQASSAGIPNESARQTAWACAWINVVLSLFGCMLILLDLIMQRKTGALVMATNENGGSDFNEDAESGMGDRDVVSSKVH